MSINKKIIEYLDYKEISQREFSRIMKLSEGVLRRGKSISASNFKKMRILLPDLSIDWLLFDKGNMLIDAPEGQVNEPQATYKVKNNCCSEVVLLQRKLIETQEKLIESQELISFLQGEIQPIEKSSEKITIKP